MWTMWTYMKNLKNHIHGNPLLHEQHGNSEVSHSVFGSSQVGWRSRDLQFLSVVVSWCPELFCSKPSTTAPPKIQKKSVWNPTAKPSVPPSAREWSRPPQDGVTGRVLACHMHLNIEHPSHRVNSLDPYRIVIAGYKSRDSIWLNHTDHNLIILVLSAKWFFNVSRVQSTEKLNMLDAPCKDPGEPSQGRLEKRNERCHETRRWKLYWIYIYIYVYIYVNIYICKYIYIFEYQVRANNQVNLKIPRMTSSSSHPTKCERF